MLLINKNKTVLLCISNKMNSKLKQECGLACFIAQR